MSHNERGSYPHRGRPGENSEHGHHSGGRRGFHESADGPSEEGHSRGRGGKGSHPAHLKGKAIGLYYRDKNKKRIKKQEVKNENKAIGFKLKNYVYEYIECLLDTTKFPDAPRAGRDDIFTGMEHCLKERYTHIGDSQFKRKFLEIISGNINENLSRALLVDSKLKRHEELDEKFILEHKERQKSNAYESMLKFRMKLPSFTMREAILDLINKNQVVVISGETGCGKTTQVAQFILDDAIERGNGSITKVVCTQPRRISAVSVAERVAAERGEGMGKSVGYQIRLEKIPSRDRGSILFCTTGLLLQYMQSDPALRDFSHVILDEIHERNTESDFIVTLLKQIIPKRPDLKVVLMSATLNSDRFSQYYENCPNIHIPGFTYPVEDFYLEDILELTRFKFAPTNEKIQHKKLKNLQGQVNEWEDLIKPAIRLLEIEKKYPKYVTDGLRNPNSEVLSLELIENVIGYICSTKGPGAILIFLPGMLDITKLHQLLLQSGHYPQHRYVIYPLHSRMPTVEQKLIFKQPPDDVRKIIIATSIAETSITIEDVVYVIDCGRTKLTRFDITNNIGTLEPEWISVANSRQRRGRAGRVQPGECYHLYSKIREHLFEKYPSPEMLRTPLEQVILQAKILQLGKVELFLSSVMDPPDPRAIQLSLDLLRTLNAIDANEHLTPLGYHLAKLPLDPRTGKMIIWASMFSCVDPVFSIAASLTFKDAFYCPFGKEDEANRKKLELGMGQFSDHIALAEALKRFESSYANSRSRFCHEHFLSWNTLKLLSDMKRQFTRHLCEMKFLDSEEPQDQRANRNSHNLAMIKAIVCAGLYPNVALVEPRGGGLPKIKTGADELVKIHPSSINARVKKLPTLYLTYFLKQRSTAIYLHDTTSVSCVALLFAAPKCTIVSRKKYCNVVLSNQLEIHFESKTAGLIQRLRQEMEALLEYKITHPGTVKWDSHEGQLLMAISELVSQGYPELDEGTFRAPPRYSDNN